MIASALSCGLDGINGSLITVEADVSNGLPKFITVGLPDKAVTESQERVSAAIKNSGVYLPASRSLVNLAPAGLKKVGAVYDLPIALAILAAANKLPADALLNTMFVGELSLDGDIRPVDGVLSMALAARELGIKRFVVPQDNSAEAAYIDGVTVVGATNLRSLLLQLIGAEELNVIQPRVWCAPEHVDGVDFSTIRGQYAAKRAAEIAAAGGHNILLAGPPGGGKTMLARAMLTILPKLTFDEALEITRIHSAAGRLTGDIVSKRPFIAPHHSASKASMVGGGTGAKPGEISMSHRGVLFLDEFPEFARDVLEAMRQPMEDGFITVSRVGASATYPARFMLVAAMNLCPCGNSGSKSRRCTCSAARIHAYRRKISGPILDRMDMFIQMSEVSYVDLHGNAPAPEDSDAIRARVNACRERQHARYKGTGVFSNAGMVSRDINKFCKLTREARELYEREFGKRAISGRGNARVLRLARTIADMAESDLIQVEHIAEALQYLPNQDSLG